MPAANTTQRIVHYQTFCRIPTIPRKVTNSSVERMTRDKKKPTTHEKERKAMTHLS